MGATRAHEGLSARQLGRHHWRGVERAREAGQRAARAAKIKLTLSRCAAPRIRDLVGRRRQSPSHERRVHHRGAIGSSLPPRRIWAKRGILDTDRQRSAGIVGSATPCVVPRLSWSLSSLRAPGHRTACRTVRRQRRRLRPRSPRRRRTLRRRPPKDRRTFGRPVTPGSTVSVPHTPQRTSTLQSPNARATAWPLSGWRAGPTRMQTAYDGAFGRSSFKHRCAPDSASSSNVMRRASHATLGFEAR